MSVGSKTLLVSSGSSTKSTTWPMEKIHAGEVHKDDPRRVLESQSSRPQHHLHFDLGESGDGEVALKVGTRSYVSQAMMLTCFLLWTMSGLSTPHQGRQRKGGLTSA